MSRFPHDPTEEASASDVGSLKDALREQREHGGTITFAMTRHDPLMVVELFGDWEDDDDSLSDLAASVYVRLGKTYAERDGRAVRAVYEGELPGELHGGDPLVLRLPDGTVARLYDSGIFPVTSQRFGWAGRDTLSIDEEYLRKLLAIGEVVG